MKKFSTNILLLFIITSLILTLFIGCSNNNSNNDKSAETQTTMNEATPTTVSESTTVEQTTTVAETTKTIDGKPVTQNEDGEYVNSTVNYTKKDYKKLINFKAEYPYLIKINRINNWTIVYGMDFDGRYSVPYKAFACSTGKNIGDTPLGVYNTSDMYDWRLMVDGTYGRYAIRINNHIMLHSVPYYKTENNSLEVDQYNKLGEPASLGCIRYCVKDIKWIYDNCPKGTTVVVYDSKDEVAPLEIPAYQKATTKGKKAGWDPTDPSKKNPWKTDTDK